MADTNYDLIVLGSGPGGYVAAIRAAQLGLKTAIVERENLGGICLNWGCIPTKALLRSAEIYHYMQHAGDYGLIAQQISADIDAVVKRSRGVAKQLSQGVAFLMKKHKITVHMGDGKLTAPGKLEVKGEKGSETLTAKNIIVATGARARDLPFAPADGKRIWTYRHALVPPEMPKKLLVIGSGAIGIEFASFYKDMGAEVTVVEMLDRLVPVEDVDVSAFLEKQLKKQGMTIHTGAGVEELKATATGVTAKIKTRDGKTESAEFSHAIVAIGIVPNTENIGLEALGVKTTKGHIDTDAMCRTNVPGIWAIGDVTAPPWLAHKAMHESVIAVCTYCRPQIASVGLTEAKAKELGYEVKAGTFPFIGNGKAIALGESEGFTKTVFDAKTGELLGAHMIGAEVTELIQGYTIGKTAELVEDDFIGTVFPHPTLSETMHEGVLAAFGRPLHI
jgi:dihydrolipoamide dehydrogenase